MSDGYPTKECLSFIRKYRLLRKKGVEWTLKNVEALLDTIEANCRFPDFSIDYEIGLDVCDRDLVVKFYYSTGGWSGHEELIGELKQTWFWYLCWEQSRRGGHYVFEINPKHFEKKS